MTSIPRAEYVGDSEEAKVVDRALKLDVYLVEYKDGESKTQVRIAFRCPGSDSTFITNPSISGKAVVTTANSWFHKALTELLQQEEMEPGGGGESI